MRVLRVDGPWAREFALFGTSTIIYQGGRFVFTLAAASVLSAAEVSAWALVVALLVYTPSLLLGVTNGMARELPILTGEDDLQRAEESQQAAWVATALAGIGVFAGALVAATVADVNRQSVVLFGGLAAGTLAYFTAQSVLRSRLRFDAASAQQAAFGTVALLLAIALHFTADVGLATVAGYYGLCLVVSIAVGLLVARPSRSSVSTGVVIHLARIGFPIMLAGLLFSVYVTLDRWIAVVLFGETAAAPYALASLIATAVLVVPSVVSQQTYPRMGIARGHNASAATLRRMARDQSLLGAVLVSPIAIATGLFAWLGIPIFLPEYVAAIPMAIVLSLGLVVLSLATGYGNYLNVVGGQWRYLGAQVVGLVGALSLPTVGGILFGLGGIAFGMSLAHAGYTVTVWATATRTGIRPDSRQQWSQPPA